ncbi:hypothetical protein Tco_0190613 [Tanacetum coccineum]
MDKGFLNRISNGSKEVNKGLLEKGSLLGNIAAKVKNIDGKILGRDGKPMVARRCVRFSETTKESACGDGHDVIVDSSKVEHSPQAVAKCAVHDDGTRPVHGRNDTRVNDLNSHTNDEPVEHVISSAVCLPMEAIDEIKARFVNTLYGFPVGKRLAFPMVENYVKYAWAKYGLKRVMMHHGFFMFQFDSDSGMVKCLSPIKRVAGHKREQIDMQTDEKKDNCLFNGYRVNIPKSKLVYRVVVKPQGDKNVASNMGHPYDTTKKPSPSDSS